MEGPQKSFVVVIRKGAHLVSICVQRPAAVLG